MLLVKLYELSQIVGSIAVVASLVFIGIQIHTNMKATRAASHQASSEALVRLNLLWAENEEATRLWLLGSSDRRALTAEQKWRFDSMARAYLHVCETMYVQASLGAGDREIVSAEEDGIRTMFSSEGIRDWWAQNPYGFSTGFRKYIDALIASSAQRPR